MTRVLHVAGARPNFMKIAPLLQAFGSHPSLTSRLVHTGQHYDETMSRLFFEELEIPRPDVDLGVGSGTHAQQTALVLQRIEPVLETWKPDLVVVVGDVNSTVACALAAAKLGVPVAHVEAGLRSFDRSMPEEINRVVTDALSDLLFVSEEAGVQNLLAEGRPAERIHFVGNVMIDTLLAHRDRAMRSDVLDRLGIVDGSYGVVTLHRPANVDDAGNLREILGPILELSERLPVVFPVHPRTRPRLDAALAGATPGRLVTVDPLGYLEFLRLMVGARIVLTDSGGIQEETTVLGVPCVTIRNNTERPATIALGTNRLAGTTSVGIRTAIAEALAPADAARSLPPLWDGHAAARVATVVAAWGKAR